MYNYTDHLGNVRLSYAQDTQTNNLRIIEENNYYPFGLKHSNYNAQEYDFKETEIGNYVIIEPTLQNNYQYKYNGKEFQDELGLNFYDYQARNYDPALGRWMNIDPLAETSRRWTPYNYTYNNPIFFVDPDGMRPLEWHKYSTRDADGMLDMFGRAKFDSNGLYILPMDRNGGGDDDKKSKSETDEVVKSADKDRAKKVWAKEKGEQDNNYNFFYRGVDADLRRGAEYFDDGGADSNTIVFNAHGANDYIVGPNGSMNAKKLHEFLYANNSLYKNSKDNGVKINIRLVACKTGNSLAAGLSKYNKNMVVSAPTTNIVSVAGLYNYPKYDGQFVSYQNGKKR